MPKNTLRISNQLLYRALSLEQFGQVIKHVASKQVMRENEYESLKK